MTEEIGKIKLNFEHYSGEDNYCDGAIEDELLEITRNYSTAEYPRIIEEKKNWETLYHLSPLRENIVDWLPITKEMKVLEIGSGCGAITGALARKAGRVDCVELSRKRSLISAYRHMGCENITINVGNFQDIEPELDKDYDFICLIGVFEYAREYIKSASPYEDFLRIVGKHIKKDGRIAIAIENRLGLKYWAGCKEDHLGTWFSSLEGYPDGGPVRTFTENKLLKIAQSCGFSEYSMYYPYPDYKFMTSLYSDKRLPKAGELSLNMRNFDRERLLLFDEKQVFDTLIAEGQFPLFSNSYMLLLGPDINIKYAKYSNDRAQEYKIKTLLTCNEENGKIVKKIEKHPLSDEAAEHIARMSGEYEKLSGRYEGGGLSVNKCRLIKPEAESAQPAAYAEFEYIEGKTLEEYLDECLKNDDLEKFHLLFDEYLERISYNEELPAADYDLVFSNILISPDGEWNIIDYEWAFDRQIDTKEIAFRAVYCYLLENEKRNKLNLDLILQKMGITQEDAEAYRQQEMRFQKKVTGKRLSMRELREVIGQPVYKPEELITLVPDESKDRVQIYQDIGKGFSEENSFFADCKDTQDKEIKIRLKEDVRTLRIDPCSDYSVVLLKEIKWNGAPIQLKNRCISTNGLRIGDGVYAFYTKDPNITIQLPPPAGKENLLEASMQVTLMPPDTVKHMQKRGLF